MNPTQTEEELTRLARQQILAGGARDDLVTRQGQASAPQPVLDLAGKLNSWFVGVTIDDRLVGFFQYTPQLALKRYSTFVRGTGAIETCPFANAWLDPETILARARLLLRPGETAGTPYLSYDRSPDRLAWAVPLSSPEGERLIFVAGDYAYPAVEDSEMTG